MPSTSPRCTPKRRGQLQGGPRHRITAKNSAAPPSPDPGAGAKRSAAAQVGDWRWSWSRRGEERRMCGVQFGDGPRQRLAAEQTAQDAAAAVELQMIERIRDIASMAESDHAAGQRMVHLVDPPADRRVELTAGAHVGKPLPAVPGLNHETLESV